MNCIEGVCRRLTLSDQMSILDTSNLRDLLRVRDEEDDGRNSLARLTLGAVLGCEDIINNRSDNQFQEQQQQQQQPSRTLLDIIKDEESGTVYRGINININNNTNNNNKQKSWKSFKDRLRLRRVGAALLSSSSSNHPVSNDCDLDDSGMEISSPNFPLIRRSSFSMISGTSLSTTVPNQNVTDFDERENNVLENSTFQVIERENTVPIASSEPIVMRLSAALAAEREEQRQLASTDTQLVEEIESTTHLVTEERESSNLSVPEEEEEERRGSHQNQNERNNNEEISGNQRGVYVSNDQPLRVSLMVLLEETMDHNRQSEMGMGLVLDMEEEEEWGGDEEEENQVMIVERENKCCVCMIRQKGAAFIPCGHTFCRVCSRKLWVNRGNCPLCNAFILEILDIF